MADRSRPGSDPTPASARAPSGTFKLEVPAVFLRQLVDDQVRAQSLVRHVTRRGNEDPQALRHVCHSLANFVTNKAHHLQPCRQSLEIAGVLATARRGPGAQVSVRSTERPERCLPISLPGRMRLRPASCRSLDQAYSIFTRRLFFGGLVGATCLVLAGWFASVMATGNSGPVDMLLLALFVLNAPSLAIGFWNAALGFALLKERAHPVGFSRRRPVSAATTNPTARTAVAMVVRNEPPAESFVLLKTLVESLDRNGHLSSFDFFILSDSDRPEVVAAEEAAFASWRAEGGGSTQVFYRRRTERAGFKPGNVYDFCESAGRKYDLLVLLDSDSLMSGEVVVRLVRAMQANSRLGILQTFSVGLPSQSLFARIFSFGHRHGMRCAVVGAAWWQGDCGQFWGHNCIIRMAPFIEHCRLPYLPGGSLADRSVVNCAGHDQIEAALMRRAGYEVRFLPQEGGSYEDNPPAAPEYLLRYSRWCQGNLENLKLLDLADLVPMSRFTSAFSPQNFLAPPASWRLRFSPRGRWRRGPTADPFRPDRPPRSMSFGCCCIFHQSCLVSAMRYGVRANVLEVRLGFSPGVFPRLFSPFFWRQCRCLLPALRYWRSCWGAPGSGTHNSASRIACHGTWRSPGCGRPRCLDLHCWRSSLSRRRTPCRGFCPLSWV